MKPVHLLNVGPTYKEKRLEDGTWLITVTPPTFMATKSQQVHLTVDQYKRFKQWLDGGVVIQNALSDLSPSQREILLTGLGDEDFHRLVADEEE